MSEELGKNILGPRELLHFDTDVIFDTHNFQDQVSLPSVF